MADGRKPTGKHPEKRLTPAFVRKATKPGRYYDGNGLFLKVDPSGAKRWGQRLVNGRWLEPAISNAYVPEATTSVDWRHPMP